MNQSAQRGPRTWVLWVVRAVLAATVLNLLGGSIASDWLGKISSDSSWWLLMALPQIGVALLAVLICWAPDSRPQALNLNINGLLIFGMMAALGFGKWPLLVIGALTILVMRIRPRVKALVLESPPPVGRPRR
jgi:cytochrome bd-type quinol oxidase subunit 2